MDTNNNSTKKILIVEDDQFLREFYEEFLSSEGYTTESAPDGDTGLTKIQNGGYDLILLDIMLPKKDGTQILRDLKISPAKTPNGPIVVLTNLGQDTIIETCFSLGATGYMIKSAMNPDQILAEVKNYLNMPQNAPAPR